MTTNFEPLHKLHAHNGYILKCLLSPEFSEPNRYLATTSSDHTVRIWNVDGFGLEKTLVGESRGYQALWYNPTLCFGWIVFSTGSRPQLRSLF
jgi:WD40 repeat protein